jgi:hypothetical protein
MVVAATIVAAVAPRVAAMVVAATVVAAAAPGVAAMVVAAAVVAAVAPRAAATVVAAAVIAAVSREGRIRLQRRHAAVEIGRELERDRYQQGRDSGGCAQAAPELFGHSHRLPP